MRNFKRLAPAAIAIALAGVLAAPASAATLTSASTTLTNSTPGASGVTYQILASGVTTTPIQCVRVEFDTAADGNGGKPAGMTITGTTFTGNYVPTPGSFSGGSVDNTNGVATFTGAAQTPASASARTINLNNIVNPSTATSFYVRVNTFNNTDCSSSPVDNVVMAVATTDNTQVSAVVDPTLTFTVADNGGASCNGVSHSAGVAASGTSVNLGRLTTANLPFDSQNLVVSTNANGGYQVLAKYSGIMTAGAGMTIADWTGTNASPTASWAAGTAAFGYTTSDSTLSGTATRFTAGGAKFAAMSTTNAEVAYASAGPVNSDTNCVGYQVGASGLTKAGNYSTTVTYTVVPVF